jgi:hypothetical protein
MCAAPARYMHITQFSTPPMKAGQGAATNTLQLRVPSTKKSSVHLMLQTPWQVNNSEHARPIAIWMHFLTTDMQQLKPQLVPHGEHFRSMQQSMHE